MTKNAAAAEKYAIFLRWMTDKRVMWPRDYTLPEDEKRIRAKVQEVDAMYAALKESLQQKGMSA